MHAKLLFILLTLPIISALAHPWKPNHFVIVDTDCGIDDFRTLELLLANPTIQVLGITVSNGAVPAEIGYQKVKNRLAALHHEGILVGIQRKAVALKPYHEAIQFNWSDSIYPQWSEVEANEIIARIMRYHKEPVTFINLGSLETFRLYLLHEPQSMAKIKEVVWSIDTVPLTSWNYRLSPGAFNMLMQNNIKISAVCSGYLSYSAVNMEQLRSEKSVYAKAIYQSLQYNDSWLSQTLHDEMIALYLTDESRFTKEEDSQVNIIRGFEPNANALFGSLFTGNGANKFQVLQKLPVDSSLFLPDISNHMIETIEKYGETEWASAVLTNELHRHVGVYALIGAKMGIRARTYFGVGVDVMHVTSFAGNNPPVSCMNDGIQVSTGATVGHGLLYVAPVEKAEPEFKFEYLGQQIVIRLKPDYKNKIQQEVKQLASIYGLDSAIYWDLVRQVALNCWFNWDRNQIFTIEIVDTK